MSTQQANFNAASIPPSPQFTAAFFAAVENDESSKVRDMLEAMPSLLEARDGTEATPLMAASKKGSDAVISLLIEAGADIHAADKASMNALCYAAYNGHQAACTLLMERGADPSETGEFRASAISYARAGDFFALSDYLKRAAESLSDIRRADWAEKPVDIGTGQPVQPMKRLSLKLKS